MMAITARVRLGSRAQRPRTQPYHDLLPLLIQTLPLKMVVLRERSRSLQGEEFLGGVLAM
jgi:hypothetical protein